MGWVKVCLGSNLYIVEGITDPALVRDYLLEQLHHEKQKNDPYNSMVLHFKEMLKTHEKTPISILTGKDRIPYDENLHGNL